MIPATPTTLADLRAEVLARVKADWPREPRPWAIADLAVRLAGPDRAHAPDDVLAVYRHVWQTRAVPPHRWAPLAEVRLRHLARAKAYAERTGG